MAIYVFGEEIEIIEARMLPVWIENRPGEIRWHYGPPKKLSKKSSVTEQPMWHVKAKWKDSGKSLSDGKWLTLTHIKADDGMHEIFPVLHALAPEEIVKFGKWNTTADLKASDIFDPVDPSEVR
jgi:hypothetical protein